MINENSADVYFTDLPKTQPVDATPRFPNHQEVAKSLYKICPHVEMLNGSTIKLFASEPLGTPATAKIDCVGDVGTPTVAKKLNLIL